MGCAQSRHPYPPPRKPHHHVHHPPRHGRPPVEIIGRPEEAWKQHEKAKARLSRVPQAPYFPMAEQSWPRGGYKTTIGQDHRDIDDQHPSTLDFENDMYFAPVPSPHKTKHHAKNDRDRRTLEYGSVAEMERNLYYGPPHKGAKPSMRVKNQPSGDSLEDLQFRYENAYTQLTGRKPGEGRNQKRKEKKREVRKGPWDSTVSLLAPPQARRGTPDPRREKPFVRDKKPLRQQHRAPPNRYEQSRKCAAKGHAYRCRCQVVQSTGVVYDDSSNYRR